jgi:hypothetical protein
MTGGCEMDSSGSENSCEHGNEHSDFINGGTFLD